MTKDVFLCIFAFTMDNVSSEEQQPVSASASVAPTRPDYPKQKGKKTIGLVLFLISLVIVGGAVFYFVSLQKGAGQKEEKKSPEPFVVQKTEVLPTPTEEAKTEAVVDKKSISISVLNGTGITGEAAYLQDKLENLGYTNVKVGNASKQDYEETVVKFSSTLSKSAIDEITTELNKIYKSVKTQTGSTGSFDVEITTGLRSGQTPKPAATLSASPTSTPKATAVSSPTNSPSPTP